MIRSLAEGHGGRSSSGWCSSSQTHKRTLLGLQAEQLVSAKASCEGSLTLARGSAALFHVGLPRNAAN
jgi:hypothetical protein